MNEYNGYNRNNNSEFDNTNEFDVPDIHYGNNQNNYDMYGNQNPGYNGYYQKQNSNKGLIITISVLAGVIVIAVAALIFAVFGFMSNDSSTAAVVSTPQLAPTAAPAAAPAQEAVSNAAAAPAAPVENTTVSKYMYVANVKYSIYFRSAPAENDSNIICEIPLGTSVGFIENADSVFAKINYNGQIGYAKQIYLSDSKPYIYTGSSNTTVAYYVYVANVKNSIYLRSEPVENDSNILCEIPLGTSVGFIENADSVFAKINYNGQIGYAKRQYLSHSRPSTSSSSSTMTVVNVKHSIYLRSTPSEASDSNIITEIPLGATVTYLGTPNSTFYKISYGGTVGYSKQIYLAFN